MPHVDETARLQSGRVVTLRSDGTYTAEPAFGFHTDPVEQSVVIQLRAGPANVIVRPDGTYDLEYV